MKKPNKISTKIKLIGALLILLISIVIGTTIYLNHQNIKDALIINIAGKQRMLTQKIAKNIFYIYYNSTQDFYELDLACDEFTQSLGTLRHGDKNKGISPVPTYQISNQLMEINSEWMRFYEDVKNFKLLTKSLPEKKDDLKKIVDSIYTNNTILLYSVDKLVTMYTNHSEDKTNFIKSFQYLSAITLFLLYIYSLMQLKSIEANVSSFMMYSKMLMKNQDISNLTPLKLEPESESEIIEASDTINCFIKKINSAMEHSDEALHQSKEASSKLEELTDEFDIILDELKDKASAAKHLSNSEDIVIESTEELINSTKRLSNLKKELEELRRDCQDIKQ